MPKSEGLTPKQAKFCLEYVKDFNATQAAIRAGYSKSGAQSHASKLLASTLVSARVRELANKVRKKALLEATDALKWAMAVARSDAYELVDIQKGVMTLRDEPLKKYRKGVMELSFSQSDGETGSSSSCKVRMHDKGQALRLIFQHLKLVGDDRPTDPSSGVDEALHQRVMGAIERIQKRKAKETV